MAVKNLPTEDSLNKFSLALHFDAWSRLIRIYSDFEENFDVHNGPDHEEWPDYMLASRTDLDTVSNLIAQSSEIAMKARLCSVSPYLLLLDRNVARSGSGGVDFSNLRTIDAIDLPGAVASFCDESLPERFVRMFSDIRKSRNRFMHLGYSSRSNSPQSMIEALVTQFETFWGDRSWTKEWVQSASGDRLSFFHDGSYFTPHHVVFSLFPSANSLLTKGQFNRLWHHAKSERRYLCPDCYESGRTKWADWDTGEVSTAFLNELGDTLQCGMCNVFVPVIREECKSPECRGDVITGLHKDFEEGWCHTCADHQQDERSADGSSLKIVHSLITDEQI